MQRGAAQNDAPMNDDLPLGRRTAQPRHYDPSALRTIERRTARHEMGIGESLPFSGEDVWNAYELSWLAPGGLPRIGVLTLHVPAESPRIVESKSFKLYLGGFNRTTFESARAVCALIETDLSRETGSAVRAVIRDAGNGPPFSDFTTFCLDTLSIPVKCYERTPDLLTTLGGTGRDAVHTHLFRTVCPVTGQPDWGSVAIAYDGRLLDRASVLRYLVSYRETADFHEVATERIFVDLQAATGAMALTVDARFLRRGGIDINPFRSTSHTEAPNIRLPRQ